MNYKKLWNLNRDELKKTTTAAQRLEAAREYVRETKNADSINDAANAFSVSFDDYSRIFDALTLAARKA